MDCTGKCKTYHTNGTVVEIKRSIYLLSWTRKLCSFPACTLCFVCTLGNTHNILLVISGNHSKINKQTWRCFMNVRSEKEPVWQSTCNGFSDKHGPPSPGRVGLCTSQTHRAFPSLRLKAARDKNRESVCDSCIRAAAACALLTPDARYPLALRHITVNPKVTCHLTLSHNGDASQAGRPRQKLWTTACLSHTQGECTLGEHILWVPPICEARTPKRCHYWHHQMA